jgi:hypothetical protein
VAPLCSTLGQGSQFGTAAHRTLALPVQGFVRGSHRQNLQVASDPDELLELMRCWEGTNLQCTY